jgi:hypothetical protein
MSNTARNIIIALYLFSIAAASFYPPWNVCSQMAGTKFNFTGAYSPLFDSQMFLNFFGQKMLVSSIDLSRLLIEYVFITACFAGAYFVLHAFNSCDRKN